MTPDQTAVMRDAIVSAACLVYIASRFFWAAHLRRDLAAQERLVAVREAELAELRLRHAEQRERQARHDREMADLEKGMSRLRRSWTPDFGNQPPQPPEEAADGQEEGK